MRFFYFSVLWQKIIGPTPTSWEKNLFARRCLANKFFSERRSLLRLFHKNAFFAFFRFTKKHKKRKKRKKRLLQYNLRKNAILLRENANSDFSHFFQKLIFVPKINFWKKCHAKKRRVLFFACMRLAVAVSDGELTEAVSSPTHRCPAALRCRQLTTHRCPARGGWRAYARQRKARPRRARRPPAPMPTKPSGPPPHSHTGWGVANGHQSEATHQREPLYFAVAPRKA